MKVLTRECLALLDQYPRVTAAGVAHMLAKEYTILAPTAGECANSLQHLVQQGYAERLPSEGFGAIYRRKKATT